MKTRRTSHSRFSELPFFSREEIDSICADELSTVSLLPPAPAPVRIDRFIEKRFGKPHGYEDLPAGILGLTRFGAHGVQQVVLSASLEDDRSCPAERRVRTTLAHEVGHCLLHAHLFALDQMKPLFGDWSDSRTPKILCRGEVSETASGSTPWEYQANMVMGAILLPARLVEVAVAPFLTPSGQLGWRRLVDPNRHAAIRALADLFDVNPVVVRIRLSQMFPDGPSGQLTL